MMNARFLFCCILFLPLFSMATPCKTVLAEEDRKLWQCDHLKVLVLRGTPEERAEKMGRLIGRELSRAPLDLFADLLLNNFRDSSVKSWFVEKGLMLWTWLYDRKAEPGYHREVSALAAGAGVSVSRVRRAMLFPDTALFLWAAIDRSAWNMMGLGCSSGARRYEDGRFVYGRNLDFYGIGSYDTHPLMLVSLPVADSSELAHVAFGADGLPFGGITGFNEAGIGFSVHQNYSTDVQIGGTPMPYIGEMILRSAHSVDEALEIAKAHRPGPLWTFVISDLKTGETRAVEISRNHFVVRGMENGLFSQSNHSFNDEVRAEELIDVGTKVNSVMRSDRILELLKNGAGEPAELMASILADQREASGQLSIHADVIKPLTMQSVVLERARDGEQKVSISIDEAPTSSGRFATFKAADLWTALTSETLDAEIRNLSGTPEAKRAAQVAGSQAFGATAELGGTRKALQLLETQTTTGALLARSLLEQEEGRADKALELASLARSTATFAKEPTYLRQAVDWAELAALSSSGRKEEARSRAQALLTIPIVDPRLKHFAEDLSEGRTPDANEATPSFDFFSGYPAYVPLKPAQWRGLDARAIRENL